MTTALHARRVRFDWSATPAHWIPDDPFTTHVINTLHLLLPEGERWFCRLYKDVLPLITDEALHAQVKGFIAQESVHAYSHAAVLEHLAEQGIDTSSFQRRMRWFFRGFLGDDARVFLPRKVWLRLRLSYIATIEHFTAVLGDWILQATELDRAGADPTMLDLLRWHGAEEVEHRSVAFDVFQHVTPSRYRYLLRLEGLLLTLPTLHFLWWRGTRDLYAADPALRLEDCRYWRSFVRSARRGRLPGRVLVTCVPRYLAKGYHPSQEGDEAVALAYLTTSPAAAGL